MDGRRIAWVMALAALAATACAVDRPEDGAGDIAERLDKYTTVRLTGDLGSLGPKQREMIPVLIEAAEVMDELFWLQAYGPRDELLPSIDDPRVRRFAEINYGPWDRLADNEPFVAGAGPKPPGANFYPEDMSEEEFERAAEEDPSFRSLYTVIQRDDSGDLESVAYHEHYAGRLQAAAEKLREAATLAEDPGLERYLTLRAEALVTGDYRPSDLAWMDMKDNPIDVVIGPIETYEDRLFGLKAAFEAYVLIKDTEWSRRLARYAAFLPELQRGLPVAEEYKRESPGSESDLNAYDVVYYAGDCNAGSKTIAINLPNDETVQLEKGTRRLQLKNAMRAKFEEILVPIAGELIVEDQREHVTFDAFFANTMFHEVAHGLGIKHVVGSDRTVREALREQHSALEEGKADVLGLYMIERLHDEGELGDADLRDNHVTFLASIFRSIRFGGASAHGRANLVRYNFFEEMNAFSRSEDGTYRVDFDRMDEAVDALSGRILRLQGEGDHEAAAAFVAGYGEIGPELRSDLDRLQDEGIPVDIVFEQGVDVLGL